ncbi:S-ribosylhomocysteine lyase [Jeotgalibaca sp. MA1X17-3]|uniref:S-ribosylhomocysteine lyase n=1 Tax=Jeotgalibaca sp. MA1X17-3 TaxID=2908211 RepID=UPI001F177B62|nr:S-ribosylhomocysteine lyase [Jeotgalibaca sp. MA1X17-3]UJF15651.1 S-ribosylhomocysteine lyase [Jeotgalibaca sp. MA1X17-3]
MAKVESFQLDHNAVKAPYVRVAGVEHDEKGSIIQKIDLRFLQPNQEAFPTGALHTLEHLLATYMRDYLPGIIDISPMGCRTGFYCIKWEESTPEEIAQALEKTLEQVLKTEVVPAVTAKECGNYRDHSLFSAKEYVREVLEKGISRDPFERELGDQKA